MADRIFPTNVNEDPLDSEMVFQGIDWDNFNNRLAEVKEAGKKKKPIPPQFLEQIEKNRAKKAESGDDEHEAGDNPGIKKLVENLKPEDKEVVKEVVCATKTCKKDAKCDECGCCDDCCKCGDKDKKPNHVTKGYAKKASVTFTHPSQLSAEAVEAAIASGDEPLKNAILAARHERRVRLASKVEEMINEENEKNEKLAQRRAYRESLVQRVAAAEKAIKTANTKKSQEPKDTFVKASELSSKAKKVFAQKAIAEGFPMEYIEAMLGEQAPVVDNTVEIKEVMSSELTANIKKAAVESMVKTATLTDADYSRLIDYWTNELGYGDREWVESLFTKKYDKKS